MMRFLRKYRKIIAITVVFWFFLAIVLAFR